MQLLDRAAVTFQAVLTKADKLARRARSPRTVAGVARGLARHPAAFPEIVVTSAETGRGLDTLRAIIAEMARLIARTRIRSRLAITSASTGSRQTLHGNGPVQNRTCARHVRGDEAGLAARSPAPRRARPGW